MQLGATPTTTKGIVLSTTWKEARNVAESWTVRQLEDELRRYEGELRQAGLREQTVHTYVDRAARFVRWLDGGYVPDLAGTAEKDPPRGNFLRP